MSRRIIDGYGVERNETDAERFARVHAQQYGNLHHVPQKLRREIEISENTHLTKIHNLFQDFKNKQNLLAQKGLSRDTITITQAALKECADQLNSLIDKDLAQLKNQAKELSDVIANSARPAGNIAPLEELNKKIRFLNDMRGELLIYNRRNNNTSLPLVAANLAKFGVTGTSPKPPSTRSEAGHSDTHRELPKAKM